MCSNDPRVVWVFFLNLFLDLVALYRQSDLNHLLRSQGTKHLTHVRPGLVPELVPKFGIQIEYSIANIFRRDYNLIVISIIL